MMQNNVLAARAGGHAVSGSSSGAAMMAPPVELISLARLADELRGTLDRMKDNGKGLAMIRERVYGPAIAHDAIDTGLDDMEGLAASVLHLIRLLQIEVEVQRTEIGTLSNL